MKTKEGEIRCDSCGADLYRYYKVAIGYDGGKENRDYCTRGCLNVAIDEYMELNETLYINISKGDITQRKGVDL